MKHIDKGYTLIESLIVLGIIAGVITFGVQNSLPQTSNINHWETAFHSNWQHVRSSYCATKAAKMLCLF